VKIKLILLLIVAFPAVFVITYFLQIRGQNNPDSSQLAGRDKSKSPTDQKDRPTPVATNRGPGVNDGFHGDIHPLLFGRTILPMTAVWSPVGTGRDRMHEKLHPQLYAWFTKLKPVEERRTYTERDFSAFLPEKLGEVGQVWELNGDKIAAILQQFHPKASLHPAAAGRRAGPDGAFAILRAVSPSYLEITFRIHAEFYLTPDDWPADQPLFRAWYTPAYLFGSLVVNRQAGVVDYFRLELAKERALNVHLTVEAKGVRNEQGRPDTRQAHDIVRVEHMELTSGDSGPAEKFAWTQALDPAEARMRLAKCFYKFLDIDWAPFDQALARARERNKPIFAIVSWGSFEDQSC
jgi:hypothetical protein